jgi:hypothetical protein
MSLNSKIRGFSCSHIRVNGFEARYRAMFYLIEPIVASTTPACVLGIRPFDH